MTEPLCCNPLCKHHQIQVQQGAEGGADLSTMKLIHRFSVTRIVEGVPISGTFCETCYEIVLMFDL
jgi:hypothetical protein